MNIHADLHTGNLVETPSNLRELDCMNCRVTLRRIFMAPRARCDERRNLARSDHEDR